MDVRRLLAEEEEGWRALHEAFARVPPERFEEPALTEEGWSAKDVMFHVGAWMAEAERQLSRMRMGTYRDEGLTKERIDEINHEWFEVSRSLDPDTVRAEFHAARVRMLQEWEQLTDVTPDAWEWFEESGPIHYAEHLPGLRAFAERPGGVPGLEGGRP
jgi:Mycothiol maleylpyruvate isomerase N-terminal domain